MRLVGSHAASSCVRRKNYGFARKSDWMNAQSASKKRCFRQEVLELVVSEGGVSRQTDSYLHEVAAAGLIETPEE